MYVNLIPFILLHGCFFLGGCGQWFFSPIIFVIFGTNTLGKFLEKNSTNFAIFLGRIHQKNNINMYIYKKNPSCCGGGDYGF